MSGLNESKRLENYTCFTIPFCGWWLLKFSIFFSSFLFRCLVPAIYVSGSIETKTKRKITNQMVFLLWASISIFYDNKTWLDGLNRSWIVAFALLIQIEKSRKEFFVKIHAILFNINFQGISIMTSNLNVLILVFIQAEAEYNSVIYFCCYGNIILVKREKASITEITRTSNKSHVLL